MSDLPIEPLDDAAWRRVEAGVLERLEREPSSPLPARRPWRWAVGAAAALAALLLVALLVEVWRPSEPAPLASTRVETGESEARTQLGDVSLTLAPRTRLTGVGSDAAGWVIVLETGQVRVDVPARAAVRVEAADVRIAGAGAAFSVHRADFIVASVERGRVRVTLGATRTWLLEGERWSSAPEAQPDMAEDGARESAREPTPAAAPPPRTSPTEEPAALFAAASRAEARAPDRADRLYARVAATRGAWAANALFARGRLAHERGHRVDAARHLATYLRRFPSGPNAADARRLLTELEEPR